MICNECRRQPRTDATICETCQEGMCVECFPSHPCAMAAARELSIGYPAVGFTRNAIKGESPNATS